MELDGALTRGYGGDGRFLTGGFKLHANDQKLTVSIPSGLTGLPIVLWGAYPSAVIACLEQKAGWYEGQGSVDDVSTFFRPFHAVACENEDMYIAPVAAEASADKNADNTASNSDPSSTP